MTDELIRRSDAIEAVKAYLDLCCLTEAKFHRGMEDYNEEISTEIFEKIEPKRGEWKPFDLTWGRSIWYCTACEESTEAPCDIWEHKPIYKYCPNCGADMREREGE